MTVIVHVNPTHREGRAGPPRGLASLRVLPKAQQHEEAQEAERRHHHLQTGTISKMHPPHTPARAAALDSQPAAASDHKRLHSAPSRTTRREPPRRWRVDTLPRASAGIHKPFARTSMSATQASAMGMASRQVLQTRYCTPVMPLQSSCASHLNRSTPRKAGKPSRPAGKASRQARRQTHF